jgi:plasmid stability protein
MTSITVRLDDAQAARLKHIADQRGQTLEQTVQSLLVAALPDAQTAQGPMNSTLALAGIVDDALTAPLSAREIDEVLAAEAAGPYGGR